MSPRLQNLPVLQPSELRLRLALRLAGEDGGGANRPSDGLWSLNKLSWSWKRRETESQVSWPGPHNQKKREISARETNWKIWAGISGRKSESMRRKKIWEPTGYSGRCHLLIRSGVLYYRCMVWILLQIYNSGSINRIMRDTRSMQIQENKREMERKNQKSGRQRESCSTSALLETNVL